MHLILAELSHFMHLADAGSLITNSANTACGGNCGNSSLSSIFGDITNVLIYLVGSISVVMIIIGGLRYVLSNGDPKGAEGAKNTILYAVIGIIVAIAAFAIVKFVSSNFK